MPYLAKIVVFWIAVCAAIWLLKRFPASLPARVAFARLGPEPIRGELRSRYLLRWTGCLGTWFAQALSVWAACWLMLRLDPTLLESTEFVVFASAIVPLLGAASGGGALVTLGLSLRLRRHGAALKARRASTGHSYS